MLRRAARKLVRVVRRVNRAWVDALDPEHGSDEGPFTEATPRPEPPAPPREPTSPTPAPVPDHASSADRAPVPDHAPSADRAPAAAPSASQVEVWAEETPNPDAMKFSASVPVSPRGALSFDSAEAAGSHPLGRAVFGVGQVRSMFAVNDFVTVTREPGADWSALAPRLEAAIADALSR